MFISISKTGSGRYIFHVGDDPKDDEGAWLSSFADTAVLGETPPTFASFGEAHSVASRLVDERPSCILAKKVAFYSDKVNSDDHREIAEGEIVSHYIEQVEIIGQRIAFLRDANLDNFDTESETVSAEVNAIKDEVKKLIPLADGSGQETFEAILVRLDKFSEMIETLKGPKKTASEKPLVTPTIYKTAIRAFSEAAMLAVAPSHEDVFVKGATFFPKTASYESVLSTPKGDLVRLAFDKNLLLYGITPCDNCLTECSASSGAFFTRYWEPIVNAVGHFHSKNHSLVAVAGMDMSQRDRMKAFSMKDNSNIALSISRPLVLGRRTWMLNKTSATIAEPPATSITIGDEVECTQERLPTYAGRTGFVTEVAEKTGRMLYRVDFRRGVGPIWLEDSSVKKVQLGV